jgi:Family of unknown function (DUF6480)
MNRSGAAGYAQKTMTAIPPDPDPAQTPGLEPGGGVAPGSTPPDSAQTSGLSEPEPRARRKFTPTVVASLIAVAVLVLLFAATALVLVF